MVENRPHSPEIEVRKVRRVFLFLMCFSCTQFLNVFDRNCNGFKEIPRCTAFTSVLE